MKTLASSSLLSALLLCACAGAPADDTVAASAAAVESGVELDAVQRALLDRLPLATDLTRVENGLGGKSYGFSVNGVAYMAWQERNDGAYEWVLFELDGAVNGKDSVVVPIASLETVDLEVAALVDRFEQNLGAAMGTPSIAVALGTLVPGLTFARIERRQVQQAVYQPGPTTPPGVYRDSRIIVLAKGDAEYVFFSRSAGTGGPHRIMAFAKASDWDGVAVSPMTACAGTRWLAGVDTPGFYLPALVKSFTDQCGAIEE